jgi:pyruvate ferredoxin oxidoreductase delta subunit
MIQAKDINENSPLEDLTPGGEIYEPGTARQFNTGTWRTDTPVFIEEDCKHCMLCIPFCPDSAIPVKDGKRLEFIYMHCKGCGICVKVCPFAAIKMTTGGEANE